MPLYDDIVVISSDDEDEGNMANPILLDDDMDWSYTPPVAPPPLIYPPQKAQNIIKETKHQQLAIEPPTYSPTTISLFGFTSDILDYINKHPELEVKHDVEEPDWTFIADDDIKPDPVTKAWIPPTDQAIQPPTQTVIPKGMDALELFARLDFYQHSMNQYVNELRPNHKSHGTQSGKETSVSPGPTRTSLKRNKAYSPNDSPTLTKHTQVIIPTNSYSALEFADIHATLVKRLELSYLSVYQRPYIPNVVWHGSNWEDWAQFTPGDLIHVPFTQAEDTLLARMTQKSMDKRRKPSPSALLADNELWNEIAVLLPGRESQDCRYRYMDMQKPTKNAISRAQLVVKEKPLSKTKKNYHDLVSNRSVNRRLTMPIYESALWTNLENRAMVGDGSGDAACLLVEQDPTSPNNFQLIAGSLCDDNDSYNIAGNLRLWRSATDQIRQLEGHVGDVQATDGGTQALWRTVHDVKVSNNKKLLFSASRDKSAKVWSTESYKLLSTLAFHSGPVHQLAVMGSEEHIIATGSADGSGVIWVIGDKGRSGKGNICETEMANEIDGSSVECVEFGHEASDKMLFMGYRTDLAHQPGWITAFDVMTATSKYDIKGMMGAVSCLAVSHSGKFILSGNDSTVSGDQMLHVNDVITGKSVLMAPTGHLDVNCVCFSQCDNYIASGSVANQVSVFDIRKPSKPVYEFAHNGMDGTEGRYIAPDAGIGIAGMHWTKNNRLLITGGGDCTVKVWDVFGSSGLLKSYQTSDPINCLTVNEELHVLAAGVSGAQGIVHIWKP